MNKEPLTIPMMDQWHQVTYLTDVNSMAIFVMNDKKYFFFGDQHDSKSKGGCEEKHHFHCDDFDASFQHEKYYDSACTSIGVLLHNWFLYNNDHHIQTDFYLEHAFTKEDVRDDQSITENTSWLDLESYLMRDCLVRDKTNCPFHPYIHAHYVDIRKLAVKNETWVTNPFILNDVLVYLDDNQPITRDDVLSIKNDILYFFKWMIIHTQRLMESMMTSHGFEALQNEYDHLSDFSNALGPIIMTKIENSALLSVVRDGVTMHRVAAELQRLEQIHPTIAKSIREFIHMKTEHYKIIIQNQFDIITQYANTIVDMLYKKDTVSQRVLTYAYHQLKHIFSIMANEFVPLSALSMDAYLLSRLFLQTNSQEAIVYAGFTHIDHYVDFFQQYLVVQPVILIPHQQDNRCLYAAQLPHFIPVNKYRTYVAKKTYNIYQSS